MSCEYEAERCAELRADLGAAESEVDGLRARSNALVGAELHTTAHVLRARAIAFGIVGNGALHTLDGVLWYFGAIVPTSLLYVLTGGFQCLLAGLVIWQLRVALRPPAETP